MEQLELDPLYVCMVQMVQRLQHHFFRFSGKEEDHVNDNLDPCRAQIVYGPVKDIQRIAPPDKLCCFRMDRLQSQFDPDRFDLVQAGEKSDHVGAQAVGPGGDGQDLYIRIPDRFRKYFLKIVHRGVSVGKCLEIGDI